MVKNLKILLVGHVTESYGPLQALPEYLKKRVKEFAVITHPFSYSGIPQSKCSWYKNGQIRKEYAGPKYKTFDLFHYLGDLLLTLYFVLRLKKHWDLYIGSDCLNVFSGIILRKFKLVKRVVFYEYDFTPERFKNQVLNRIFHYFNSFAARRADVIWDNPPNLKEIRQKQGANLKKIIRVPHGVDLEKIKIPPVGKINRHTLVYAGHLTQDKGLQLAVKALKKVIKKDPRVKVVLIGSGPYQSYLEKQVKKNRLEKYFDFLGFTDHDKTLSLLPSYGIALAPYVFKAKGTFKYADPLKVKDYLGCGLPIIITKVPSIAKKIERKKWGLAINYNQNELEKALIKLLTNDQFYQDCRRNIRKIQGTMDWQYIYHQTLSKTLKILSTSKEE